MEVPKDFTHSSLEKCSYRCLQQLAKSMSLPSNVKKVHLVQMIYTKKNMSADQLSSMVTRIKEERQQSVRPRKVTNRKKKQIQGAEVSSTGNLSPPIFTTPTKPRKRCQLRTKRYRSISSPTVKKANKTDRVLRSNNNRLRRDSYSIININNMDMMRAQAGSPKFRARPYHWNMGTRKYSALRVGDCVVQGEMPLESTYVVNQQQPIFVDVGQPNSFDGERRLVTLERTANSSTVRDRQGNMHTLQPKTYYQPIPQSCLRRQDVREPNAPQDHNPESLLKNKMTQTVQRRFMQRPVIVPMRNALRPKLPAGQNISYKIRRLSVSSTEPPRSQGSQEASENGILNEKDGQMNENYSNENAIKLAERNLRRAEIQRSYEITKRYNQNQMHAIENQTLRNNRGYTKELQVINNMRRLSHVFHQKYQLRKEDNQFHAVQDTNSEVNSDKNQRKWIGIPMIMKNKANQPTYKFYDSKQWHPLNKMHASRNKIKRTSNEMYASQNEIRPAITEIYGSECETLPTNNETYATHTDSETISANEAYALDNETKPENNIPNSSENETKPVNNKANSSENESKPANIEANFSENEIKSTNEAYASENETKPPNNEAYALEHETIRTYNENKTSQNELRGSENLTKCTDNIITDDQNTIREISMNDTKNENLTNDADYKCADIKDTISVEEYSKIYEKLTRIENSNEVDDSKDILQVEKTTLNHNIDTEGIKSDTEDKNQNSTSNVVHKTEVDYRSMPILTDFDSTNQEMIPENVASGSKTVDYREKKRVKKIRLLTPLEAVSVRNNLPRIGEAFSQFKEPRYKDFMTPLYVYCGDYDEHGNPAEMYSLENLFSVDPFNPAVVSADSGSFHPTSDAAVSGTSPADRTLYNCQLDAPRYKVGGHPVPAPQLFDYLRIGEQMHDIDDSQVLQQLEPTPRALTSHAGAGLFPERNNFEDALDCIGRDGEYLELIGMVGARKSCLLCDWAGPRSIAGYHLRLEHQSDIVHRTSSMWCTAIPLGAARRGALELSEVHSRYYVMHVSCVGGDCLRVYIAVLYDDSDYYPKYGRLIIYNKTNGEPHIWDGLIVHFPDRIDDIEIQGLNVDLSSLNLLPNGANLKLVNGEWVVNSSATMVMGQLDNIEIMIYVEIYD